MLATYLHSVVRSTCVFDCISSDHNHNSPVSDLGNEAGYISIRGQSYNMNSSNNKTLNARLLARVITGCNNNQMINICLQKNLNAFSECC
jgi:hypothetical protein